MDIDDDELAALIDDSLDGERRRVLLSRIAEEPALGERFEALRRQRDAARAAFDALLPLAPADRLKAMIPPAEAARARRFGGLAFRELAAGLVAGLLLASAWMASTAPPREDWRTAVVEYMELYTDETFVHIPANAEARAAELNLVGQRVGAPLTPAAVALPGLDLKTAFILAYDKSPLGEVVQIDPGGAPVLFCVIADGRADAALKSETRERFSLATWSRGGKGYLVIASLPQAQVADYGRLLEARF